MTLALVGLSHHVAPVELRERVTLDLEAAGGARARRSATPSASRPATAPSSTSPTATTSARVAALEALAGEPLDGVLYRLHDEAAALHLFRVAAGLDSLVPGEGEILGQVRARLRGRARPGRCSTASSARRSASASACAPRRRSARARRRSPRPPRRSPRRSSATSTGRRVLLVGAGPHRRARRRRTSPRAARRSRTSRTARVDTARGLAERFGGSAIALDDLAAHLGDVDVVVSSTSAPEPVLRAGDVPARRPARCSSSTSPCRATSTRRSARSTAASSTTSTISRRSSPRRSPAGAPRRRAAEQLVAEEAERFRAWQASLDVVPAIASLRARAEEIRSAELAKVDGRRER